ncbi:glycosyltransferase family 2 protein [Chloroflexota bacterium]
MKSCFEAARSNAADILIILDGDGQHNPDEIPQLLTPILKGEANLVIGSRFLANTANIPRYRKCGIIIITFLWNFGSAMRVSDAQGGFRACSKKVLETLHLSEKGRGISIETLEKARGNWVIM